MSKIFGIGIDIVENARVGNLMQRFGQKFLERIFSVGEIDLAGAIYPGYFIDNIFDLASVKLDLVTHDSLVNYFAKRFAAKEAFSKALGTGFNGKFHMNWMGVLKNSQGAPIVELTQDLNLYTRELIGGEFRVFVSLSDEKKFSIAQVIIEKI